MLKTITITSRRVNDFLEAMGRNSNSSKASYTSALEHLRNMIAEKYPRYDYDNIIDAMMIKEVDVYELLNNFVAYAMNRNITEKSVLFYTSVLKSYFSFHGNIDGILYWYRKYYPKNPTLTHALHS